MFHYEERLPPPELAGAVRCVWSLTGPIMGRRPEVQPIVPDGCPEIVLNLADPFVQIDPGGMTVQQPRAMLVGQLTRSALVRPDGATRIVGIRFLPWGASRLLGVPMAEIRNAFLPLNVVFARGMEELAERLAAAPAGVWAEVVFDCLRKGLRGQPIDRRPLSACVVQEIAARAGRVSIRMLARQFHVTDRQVERVMRRDVGLPPIVLARILRLQAALQLMRGAPSRSLGQVAASAGYSDQSHMAREFRHVIGCSPSRFVDAQYELTDHFIVDRAMI